MKLTKFIPTSITNRVGRTSLQFARKSPTLLFAGGMVGVLSGTVLACRATLKAGPALDAFKEEVEDLKKGNLPAVEGTTEYRKDLAYVYGKNVLVIARLYAPPVILIGAGVACLTGSHIVLKNRNNALMAAYAGLSAAYENYRGRVRDAIGEDKELDLYHAVSKHEILGPNGKTVVVKAADPNQWSAYARFFNESSQHFQDDPECNRIWVQCQQEYLNNLLRARGHVFLNEAYDALGLERSSAGQMVGWVKNGEGDNYIDFGLFNAYQAEHFDAREPIMLLDFNVDGVIYDLLEEK